MKPETITIIGIILSGFFSFAAAYLVFRIQAKRAPAQNLKDEMSAASLALEIAESATRKQLEQEKKIEELTRIMKSQSYRVTVVFSLGETPRVESTSIEVIPEKIQQFM